MDIDLTGANLAGRAHVLPRVSRAIAAGDGMFRPHSAQHYFVVGASASALIHEALRTAGVAPASVGRVLDYACGYGRVLRWLKADFPDARLLGVDADPKAAQAAGEALGVETRALDLALSAPIEAPFDLVWVGSLFTHLPRAETQRVLDYLAGHLRPGGVLVFTTHGELVRRRLADGERNYGLDAAGVAAVLRGLQAGGYGYAGYPRTPDYGISVAHASTVMAQAESTGLHPVLFRACGWAAHQDAYAFQRAV